MKPTIDTLAPNFEAADQNGIKRSLKDYKGKYLLLYFYPKDDTPGCTKEACAFRDHYTELKKRVEIVGVSGDNEKSHQKFIEKYQLPFALLVDKDKKIIADYGANGVIFPKRVSFLIDPNGKIVKIYEKVTPSEHAQEILNDLTTL